MTGKNRIGWIWLAAVILVGVGGYFMTRGDALPNEDEGVRQNHGPPSRAELITIKDEAIHRVEAIPYQGDVQTRVCSGAVVVPGGESAEAISVLGLSQAGSRMGAGLSDSIGNFRVEMPREPGQSLFVRHVGYEDFEYPLPPDGNVIDGIRIVLTPGGSVGGVVRTAGGGPLPAGVLVHLHSVLSSPEQFDSDVERAKDCRERVVAADAHGRFWFHGLGREQQWRIRASAAAFSSARPMQYCRTGDHDLEVVLLPIYVFAVRFVEPDGSPVILPEEIGDARGVNVAGLPVGGEDGIHGISLAEAKASGVKPPFERPHGTMWCEYFTAPVSGDVLRDDVRISGWIPGYARIDYQCTMVRASATEIRWNTIPLERLAQARGRLRVRVHADPKHRMEDGEKLFDDRALTALHFSTPSHGRAERTYSVPIEGYQDQVFDHFPAGAYTVSVHGWPQSSPECRVSPTALTIPENEEGMIDLHVLPCASAVLSVTAPSESGPLPYSGPLMVQMWTSEHSGAPLVGTWFERAPYRMPWINPAVVRMSVLPSLLWRGPFAESEHRSVQLSVSTTTALDFALRSMP